MSSDSDTSFYVHGSSTEERARLSLLNRIINERCLDEMSLAGGERIIDVGCGLGQFTRAMARAAGGRERGVVGVERNPDQIETARRLAATDGEEGLVEFRAGDALELPLEQDEWGSFDLLHARFLLEHLPDPLGAVRYWIRALLPGGRIVLMDDDHDLLRFSPEASLADRLWRAYADLYATRGHDARVGRRLATLIHEAGGIAVRVAWIPYLGCFGSPGWSEIIANLSGVMEGAGEAIASAGILTPDEIRAGLEEFTTWSRRPGSTLWYAMSWAEGLRAGPGRGGVARGSGLP